MKTMNYGLKEENKTKRKHTTTSKSNLLKRKLLEQRMKWFCFNNETVGFLLKMYFEVLGWKCWLSFISSDFKNDHVIKAVLNFAL
jgi:hypothetical protein